MTKESLLLLVFVGAALIGIVYAIKSASSNEADWDRYRTVRLGDSRSSIRAKFGHVSEDLRTLNDARSVGYATEFKKTVDAGGSRLLVVKSREDDFIFGFDADDRLVFTDTRR